jgi:hypothetical protein
MSGVDRVLEETVTRHHLWELTDLAALAGEMNLHVRATTKARRDEQSLSFLCSRLTLTREESLLFPWFLRNFQHCSMAASVIIAVKLVLRLCPLMKMYIMPQSVCSLIN